MAIAVACMALADRHRCMHADRPGASDSKQSAVTATLALALQCHYTDTTTSTTSVSQSHSRDSARSRVYSTLV